MLAGSLNRDIAHLAEVAAQQFQQNQSMVEELPAMKAAARWAEETIDHPWIRAIQPSKLLDSEHVRRLFKVLLDDQEAQAKFGCISFLVIAAIYVRCYLFFEYACLDFLVLIMIPFTQRRIEAILDGFHESSHDLGFFYVLAGTNATFLLFNIFATNLAASVGLKAIVLMLLEALNSAFNQVRVGRILLSTNGNRKFHPLEVLVETVFIEIAPVNLLSWCFIDLRVGESLSQWDKVGAFGLLLLAVLLRGDTNISEKFSPQTRNGEILLIKVLQTVEVVWPYLIHITVFLAIAMLAWALA